ncbi:hypothetical protein E9531_09315 [Lampropedia puyangensis]|uniref:Uncharacterized protein n=1 Tax=Lampropedia puyangensis TaxID=1330072 RepID=A0A4S8F478_9BURK|nr:hypothetical protein E9531_09315 [Lampropedia puyangensis]
MKISSMDTPKPIDEISVDDLHKHPVWRYALESEEDYDETHVLPVTCLEVPYDNDVYHVACTLTLATGKDFVGFMSICNGNLHDDAPVVVSNEGQWSLDVAPSVRQRAIIESILGTGYEDAFPVSWTLKVMVEGEKQMLSGTYQKG